MDYHQVSKYTTSVVRKGDRCWPVTRKGFQKRWDLGLKTTRIRMDRHPGQETMRKKIHSLHAGDVQGPSLDGVGGTREMRLARALSAGRAFWTLVL